MPRHRLRRLLRFRHRTPAGGIGHGSAAILGGRTRVRFPAIRFCICWEDGRLARGLLACCAHLIELLAKTAASRRAISCIDCISLLSFLTLLPLLALLALLALLSLLSSLRTAGHC